MHAMHWPGLWIFALLLGLAGGVAAQDAAPARVGRIAEASGDVRLFDARTQAWVQATRNRSFAAGERLAVAGDASAQIEVGASALLSMGLTNDVSLFLMVPLTLATRCS